VLLSARFPTAAPEDREVTPREAVVRRLALAHDRFDETEQMHKLLGNIPEAEGAHQYARICLRAYIAEVDDPEAKPR
jgi:hypothetical protein